MTTNRITGHLSNIAVSSLSVATGTGVPIGTGTFPVVLIQISTGDSPLEFSRSVGTDFGCLGSNCRILNSSSDGTDSLVASNKIKLIMMEDLFI